MKQLPWKLVAFVAVAIIFVVIRLNSYLPVGDSISTHDTQAFVASSQIPFLSADFFTSDRPATISLLYKILQPTEGYQISAFSSPAEDISQTPGPQPGLDRVAYAQSLLSMAAWLTLAYVVYRQLKNPWFAVLGAALILAFGFTPPMAEWDYVLLSEPFSLTLFVFLLAVSIELVSRLAREGFPLGRQTKVVVGVWAAVLLLWVFARDTNAYLVLVFFGLCALLLVFSLWGRFSEILPTRTLGIAMVLLGLLFVVHNATMQQSGRWMNPFFNNMLHSVFPYPDRLAFFESRGMPITDEVLALRTSPGNEDGFFQIPELVTWVKAHGTGAYIQFLLSEPAWVFENFFVGVETSFSENRQPFFVADEEVTTPGLSYLGDLFHASSTFVIWVGFAQLALFGALAWRRGNREAMGLFVLLSVFFVGEILMLFISIHGDALATVRHALGSVMPMRLSLWLLPPFILDLVAQPSSVKKKRAQAKR